MIVLLLTISNMLKYNERFSKEDREKKAFFENVGQIARTDSQLLNMADSLVANTMSIIEIEDSIDVRIGTALNKLDNINKSVRNVRLR